MKTEQHNRFHRNLRGQKLYKGKYVSQALWLTAEERRRVREQALSWNMTPKDYVMMLVRNDEPQCQPYELSDEIAQHCSRQILDNLVDDLIVLPHHRHE